MDQFKDADGERVAIERCPGVGQGWGFQVVMEQTQGAVHERLASSRLTKHIRNKPLDGRDETLGVNKIELSP